MIVGIEQVRLAPEPEGRSVPVVSTSLIEEVEKYGQLTPVIVFKTAPRNYTILKNAESWIAVQRAGLLEVEVIVRDEISVSEAADISAADIKTNPIAQARFFEKHLFRAGQGGTEKSIASLARKLNISPSQISHSLRLLTLSPVIQESIQDRLLTAGHAKALLTIADPIKQAELAIQSIKSNWSVREIRQNIKLLRNGDTQCSVIIQKSPETRLLEKNLTAKIGCSVIINELDGKVEIDYSGNLDILEGILKLIMRESNSW